MPLVKFGGRRLLLSASDLVLPLCCGIVLHLFFVISLVITHYFLPTTDCTQIIYYFIYTALVCHGLIVIFNFIGTYLGLRVKVMTYSIWLTRILYIRTALNFIDVLIAIWGLYLIITGDLKCLEQTPYILLIVSVMINWLILFIGCCGVCCLTTSNNNNNNKNNNNNNEINNEINNQINNEMTRIRESSAINLHENDTTSKKIESKLRSLCCACLWENRAWNHGEVSVAFNEMTSMMKVLISMDHLNNTNIKDLAPSDIFTGLQLYRMLQKHYQLHDIKFYYPYLKNNYKHKFIKMKTDDIILEINNKKKKKKPLIKHVKKNKNDNDFIALADISLIDKDEEIEEEKYNIDKSSHSNSKSTTPESPLLNNNKEEGFGTFDMNNSINNSQNNNNNINKIQSYLYSGLQPVLNNDELYHINQGIYYSKYAIAAYGLPLYTLEYPFGILCAMPCCLPNGMNYNKIYGKACCGLSSIKVFLRRSNINGNDLLLASQLSGLNQITFFIAIDRNKKNIVIAIRGSESMPDGMIDVNCKPTKCNTINNECYAHDGFKLTMIQLFNTLEEHDITQQFLNNNKDYGIIVTGHSLGAGVSVMLTLQLLMNTNNNINYVNRQIHCYGIATPPTINELYANKIKELTEKHITTFIYNKDMVPRLQWNSIMKMKYAIIRLLTQCNQSSWWVYRQGLSVNHKTIINALNYESKYLLYDNNNNMNNNNQSMGYIPNEIMIDNNEIIIGDNDDDINDNDNENNEYLERLNKKYIEFQNDINNDLFELNNLTSNKNIEFKSLWDIKLQQIGRIFHIVNGNEVNINSNNKNIIKECVCCSCLCSAICNCCRCKCCNPSSLNPLKNDNYIIYRADPNGFTNNVIISSRMASDHMPHVYKNVLNSLDVNKLTKISNSNNSNYF
eukprot:341009_1